MDNIFHDVLNYLDILLLKAENLTFEKTLN
jgi:hypothetical protein